MRIDSHQHFWRYEPTDYPWIQSDWPIRKSYLPSDLKPLLEAHRFDGCISVQARQSLEETRWLLELADAHEFIRGVVGWVDLRHPEVRLQIERFASHPKLVGVRHVVQDEPDKDFMLGSEFQRGIATLVDYDLRYDILIYPVQLPAAIALVTRFPNQPFVLDHIAKPRIGEGLLEPWRDQIRELAKRPNVHCKVSGMVTETHWNRWKQEDFDPYLEVVLEAFGAHRLLYGSDWPVALLSAEYEQVFALANRFVGPLSASEQSAILGENARQFYLLP